MKTQLGILSVIVLAALLLGGWQFQQRVRQKRLFASLTAELQSKSAELDQSQSALDELERRKRDLLQAEQQAGNQTALSLARARAAARAQADQAAGRGGVANALATMLANPEQREIEREYVLSYLRAESVPLFKALNLDAATSERYVTLRTEAELRKTDRMSALLRGTISLPDALRERDQENARMDGDLKSLLGADGFAFIEGIRTRRCADEAARTVGVVERNMGAHPLTTEQSERLKGLIGAELAVVNLDDTDLFRTPDEWARVLAGHQQQVLQQAAAFLTPEQLQIVSAFAAQDLAQKRREMEFKRNSHGIR